MNILKCSKFIIIESDNFKFTLLSSFNTKLNMFFIRATAMSFSTKTEENDQMRGRFTFPLFTYEFNSKDLTNVKRKQEYLINKYEEEFYNKTLAYLDEYEDRIITLKKDIALRKDEISDEEAEEFFASLE